MSEAKKKSFLFVSPMQMFVHSLLNHIHNIALFHTWGGFSFGWNQTPSQTARLDIPAT